VHVGKGSGCVLHLHDVVAEGGSVVVRHSRAVVTGLAVERRQATVQGDEGKTRTRVFDLILGLG
jgi:hypothetical protein